MAPKHRKGYMSLRGYLNKNGFTESIALMGKLVGHSSNHLHWIYNNDTDRLDLLISEAVRKWDSVKYIPNIVEIKRKRKRGV